MTIYTVTSTDDLAMEPLARCVAGSYTERGRAIDGCVKYILERIGLRGDLAYSMAHDENHPEAAKFFSQWADVVVLARELSLAQIAEVHRAIVEQDIRGPHGELLRIEMFAHGALCMSISCVSPLYSR